MRKWMTAGMCFLLVMMTISGCTDTLQENTKRDSSDSISVQDNLSDETASGESNAESVKIDIREQEMIEKTENYQVYELTFARDNLTIYGHVYLPESTGESYPTVIIGHGFGSSYTATAEDARRFAEAGIASFVFDFCGGAPDSRSDGSMLDMSVLTELDDMETVLDGIKEYAFVDENNLFLMGESQGGFVAALLAAKREADVRGLILFYPAFVIPDNARAQYSDASAIPETAEALWMTVGKRYYADILDMNVWEEICKFGKNVLLVHGNADRLVPVSYSEQAAGVYPSSELVVIEGAGHGFAGSELDKACQTAITFVEQNREPSSQSSQLAADIELTGVPDDYYTAITNAGHLERFSYRTKNYAKGGDSVRKEAIVYLPYGYDEADAETRYDILYLMHGGGGSETTYMGREGQGNRLKNMIDHMIACGDIEPLIIVMPTFPTGGLEECRESALTFPQELVAALIPSIEGKYHTYAAGTTEDELISSREHRIFGGFSMGGVTTWSVLTDATEYFRYYMPMSSDCWELQAFGGRDRADETTEYLYDTLTASGYSSEDFQIFAAAGTEEFSGLSAPAQITSMKNYPDMFSYTERDFEDGNFTFYSGQGYGHDYPYTYEYIYNGLRMFEPIMRGGTT